MRLCTKDFSGSYVKANQVHLTLKLTRVRNEINRNENSKLKKKVFLFCTKCIF